MIVKFVNEKKEDWDVYMCLPTTLQSMLLPFIHPSQ